MYGRIVVGTDGSETAARAVERAVSVARATGSALSVVSVGGAGALEVARAAVARFADSGVDIEARAAEGEPAKALVQVARDEQAGLIVVGSRGMQGARHVLGSVPNSVSHHAPCHVLIAHTA